jgi:hypothetical protein
MQVEKNDHSTKGTAIMKRWYDSHRVGKYLDIFKTMHKRDRDPVVNHILELIKVDGHALIDAKVMEFPLDETRRRWYDKDPSLWMVFHGLERADKDLLDEIAEYLEKQLHIAEGTAVLKSHR